MNSQDLLTKPTTGKPVASKNKPQAGSNGAEARKSYKPSSQNPPPVTSDSGADTRRESVSINSTEETTFHVDAPAATHVLLAGDFTEWEKSAIKMIKGGGGVWHAKVPLAPGRHLYRFLVDGQWQDDQTRPEREPNSFGTTNSVIEIK